MKLTDRINRLLHKNKYTLPLLQGLGIIALVTLISVMSVHFLTGDTLTDYAKANPEKAYAERIIEPAPESEDHAETGPDNGNEINNVQDTEDIRSDMSGTGSVNESVTEAADLVEGSALAEVSDSDTGSDSAEGSDSDTDSAPAGNNGPVGDSVTYNRSAMIHFYDPDNDPDGRYTLKYGFYYEPLGQDVRDYITGSSYPGTDDMVITYDDLRYVGILYVDFNGLTQAGELICNRSIAGDLVEIFGELYDSDYRIDSVCLIDNYAADDTASMTADNTSCFNYRVVDGSTSLSKHAYGLAIDINPFYNPYIVFGAGENGSDYISPPGSEIYADRSASFPYKIDDSDLCYRLFISHGFKWGGNWNSCKDYQHFQKTP